MNTKYYPPTALRVEALRAVSKVTETTLGGYGNLISGIQTIYEWLKTGKDPIVDKSEDK